MALESQKSGDVFNGSAGPFLVVARDGSTWSGINQKGGCGATIATRRFEEAIATAHLTALKKPPARTQAVAQFLAAGRQRGGKEYAESLVAN
jgi:hypothetical protein